MKLEEIKALECDFLSVKQVAECLHLSPQLIRDQSERDVRLLGFPICRAGHSFRIPKEGFVAWATGNVPMIVLQDGVAQ